MNTDEILRLIDGIKTIIGSSASIGLGIYMFFNGQFESGVACISAGIVALGIAHKFDKNTNATKELTKIMESKGSEPCANKKS